MLATVFILIALIEALIIYGISINDRMRALFQDIFHAIGKFAKKDKPPEPKNKKR